jgi:hypothetical protein
MPQNRPPSDHGRTTAAAQPSPVEYTLPGLEYPRPSDENVDERAGGWINPTGPPRIPGTIVLGGTPWPVEPAMRDAFNATKAPPTAPPEGPREWVTPTEEGVSPWPAMAVKRGGTPWPNQPSDHLPPPEKIKEGARWAAPAHLLGINGEKLPGAPPPPAPRPTDVLTQAIAKASTPRPERELDPEPPSWDEELYHWWVDTARGDIRGSLDKVVQYGGRGAAYDLIATGHDLAALNGRKVGDEEAAELAVLWYLSAKCNRMLAAAIDGRRGSDDTLLDISYYSFMARRIRAVGGWPIGTDDKENTE